MSIYETIGMAWVIFTTALATIAILRLAFTGYCTVVHWPESERRKKEAPAEASASPQEIADRVVQSDSKVVRQATYQLLNPEFWRKHGL